MCDLICVETTDALCIYGVLIGSNRDTATLSMPLLFVNGHFHLATPDLGVDSEVRVNRSVVKSFRVVEDAETLRVYDEQVKRLREVV